MKPNAKSVTTALRKVEGLQYNTIANGHGPILRRGAAAAAARSASARARGRSSRVCGSASAPTQPYPTLRNTPYPLTPPPRYNMEALVGNYRDWSLAVGKSPTQARRAAGGRVPPPFVGPATHGFGARPPPTALAGT